MPQAKWLPLVILSAVVLILTSCQTQVGSSTLRALISGMSQPSTSVSSQGLTYKMKFINYEMRELLRQLRYEKTKNTWGAQETGSLDIKKP